MSAALRSAAGHHRDRLLEPGNLHDVSTRIRLLFGVPVIVLDVGDPATRDDDRSEFDDPRTTDADRTPGCRLSGSSGKGTLTIWDTNPTSEIVVEL